MSKPWHTDRIGGCSSIITPNTAFDISFWKDIRVGYRARLKNHIEKIHGGKIDFHCAACRELLGKSRKR